MSATMTMDDAFKSCVEYGVDIVRSPFLSLFHKLHLGHVRYIAVDVVVTWLF